MFFARLFDALSEFFSLAYLDSMYRSVHGSMVAFFAPENLRVLFNELIALNPDRVYAMLIAGMIDISLTVHAGFEAWVGLVWIVVETIRNTFEREPLLSFLNTLLVGLAIYLMVEQPYRMKKETKLTNAEKEELIRDWKPEPLVPLSWKPSKFGQKIVEGTTDRVVVVDGKECVNFASFNFLGIAGEPRVKSACEQTILKYGVGSCGPRGFYGTIGI